VQTGGTSAIGRHEVNVTLEGSTKGAQMSGNAGKEQKKEKNNSLAGSAGPS
jgi:hypothetical protein